jgi:hypothetical protein
MALRRTYPGHLYLVEMEKVSKEVYLVRDNQH